MKATGKLIRDINMATEKHHCHLLEIKGILSFTLSNTILVRTRLYIAANPPEHRPNNAKKTTSWSTGTASYEVFWKRATSSKKCKSLIMTSDHTTQKKLFQRLLTM